MRERKFLQKAKIVLSLLKENVIKRYPITMCLVWMIAVLSGILIDSSMSVTADILCKRVEVFLLLMAAGTLFLEECFSQKRLVKGVGSVFCAFVAVFFTYVLEIYHPFMFEKRKGIGAFFQSFLDTNSYGSNTYGSNWSLLQERTMQICCVYLTWLLIISVYHMYKRSGLEFKKYCLEAFGGLYRITIVYVLFAIGVLCIYYAFCELIYDTSLSIIGIEMFLLVAVYVPGVLLAFSTFSKEEDRFLNFVIKFVLVPLTLAAFAIIYIYIVKIMLQRSLPKNEVFIILAVLFCVGMPIWTLASNFKEDNMGKIAFYLPFAYIPFIILQIICVVLRIHQYGYTMQRYMGCFLIIFEIIYMVFYVVSKQKYLPGIVFVFAILVTVFFIPNYFSVDSVVVRSQMKRLSYYLSLSVDEREQLPYSESSNYFSAYSIIEEHYMDEKLLSKEDLEWMRKGDPTYPYAHNMNNQFVSGRIESEEFDISGYSKMNEIRYYHSEVEDLEHVEIQLDDDQTVVLDLKEYSEEARDRVMDGKNFDIWFENHSEIQFSDSKLLLKDFSMSITHEKISYITFSGYYLRK